jgi:hypothetical protein
MHGLPEEGGTCPGATMGPGGCLAKIKGRVTCYTEKTHRLYPKYSEMVKRNTELLRDKSENELVIILRNTVMKFLLNGGYKAQYFRIHMEGDFFSQDYTKAWARVIQEWPTVRFWVYTRSFWAVPLLVDCKNLSIYLSCDPQNIENARTWLDIYGKNTNVGMAWMGDSVPDGLPKTVVCPELSGKVKNTKDHGACSKCRLCMIHTETIKLRNIQFPLH